MTRFGKRLGQLKALAFVAGAGPVASLLTSSIAMIVGKVLQKRYRMLSLYLIAYGRSDLFAHGVYALSAQFSSNSRMSHDFFLLSKIGVHPPAAATTYVAIPIILEFGVTSLNTAAAL